MQKYRIKAWHGQTIPLAIEWDTDITAEATLLVYSGGVVVFQKTASFSDKIATLDVSAQENEDIGVGEYHYLIKITHDGGDVDILPEGADCSKCPGSYCEAPEFKVCGVAE